MTSQAFILPPNPTDREHIADNLRAFVMAALPGKRLKVVVEEAKKRRSDDQNRALWGVAYKTLSDATGNDPEDLHTFFLGEHFGWEVVAVMGEKKRRPMRRSSGLSTVEFAEFYNFIQRRAAEAGYYVPDPNE
jgi:hypothetical protein